MTFSSTKFWLIGIFGGLAALHLNLAEHFGGKADLSSSSLLFWMAAGLLLWQKRNQLNLESDRLSCLLGTAILFLVFYKSLHLFEGDFFLRLYPLLSLLGWSLIASGIRGLKQYRRELFLVGFLAIPWEFVYLFDISLFTAKFSACILWLLGFDVTRQGVWIVLPAGSIEVYNGCSGVRMVFQLLGLSWLLLALVPTRWPHKIFLPMMAIALGFTINAVRVALMAVLVALANPAGFDYWHVGTGSLIFSAIAVLAFGGLSLIILSNQPPAERFSSVKTRKTSLS
ncbi:MAG: cyanoexosortase A [Cyanobacteria bacterium J06623_4]